MNKHNQDGGLNVLLFPLILASLFLIGALAFGAWAYSSRQDYKQNTDQKVAAAVAVAKSQESTAKDVIFAEESKKPLKPYNGPEAFGSIVIQYPKTWSSYVDETGSGSAAVDGYFYPGTVPSISSQNSTFALRLQVLSQGYSTVITALNGQLQQGQVKVSPYALPKVPTVVGVRVDGQITPTKNGSMVILPLRDKTLELSTQGDQFIADFNNYILPNASFSP